MGHFAGPAAEACTPVLLKPGILSTSSGKGSFSLFVTDATHLPSRQALNEEAMPIVIVKSVSSSAHCQNYYDRPVLE